MRTHSLLALSLTLALLAGCHSAPNSDEAAPETGTAPMSASANTAANPAAGTAVANGPTAAASPRQPTQDEARMALQSVAAHDPANQDPARAQAVMAELAQMQLGACQNDQPTRAYCWVTMNGKRAALGFELNAQHQWIVFVPPQPRG